MGAVSPFLLEPGQSHLITCACSFRRRELHVPGGGVLGSTEILVTVINRTKEIHLRKNPRHKGPYPALA